MTTKYIRDLITKSFKGIYAESATKHLKFEVINVWVTILQKLHIFRMYHGRATKTFQICDLLGEYARKPHSFSCSRNADKSIATENIISMFRF